jgi:hypothetical protein
MKIAVSGSESLTCGRGPVAAHGEAQKHTQSQNQHRSVLKRQHSARPGFIPISGQGAVMCDRSHSIEAASMLLGSTIVTGDHKLVSKSPTFVDA